jgi:hemoglobin-like flavoprotein
MITARQRLLIRSSWELMRPVAVHVADLFYDRLFELDPSLEVLFPEDLDTQRPRFMNAVGAAVGALDDIQGFLPSLCELGRRQQAEGVCEGHYITIGKALLWTFEQTLAEDFTQPVKDAWAALYAQVSNALVQGAAPREVFKPRGRTQLAV